MLTCTTVIDDWGLSVVLFWVRNKTHVSAVHTDLTTDVMGMLRNGSPYCKVNRRKFSPL